MRSWRLTARVVPVVLVAALMTVVLISQRTNDDATATAAPPVEVSERKIPLTPRDGRAPEVVETSQAADEHEDHGHDLEDAVTVAEMPETSVDSFRMLGVTWASGLSAEETLVEVRWRTDDTWSDWTELHIEGGDSAEGIPGTEPQWVGRADAATVRVASQPGAEPVDLQLSTIDPGDSTDITPVSYASSMASADLPDGLPGYTPRPSIISRSSWGASGGDGSCDSPINGDTLRGAVVHHTAGSNSYSKADSPSIMRATQSYHKNSRGWCDIGYNFLIDKYGQIFHGRAGAQDEPVRGAHAGNGPVNEETMGVSLMGTFTSTAPSSAMKDATIELIGWRLGTNYIPAKGRYSLGGVTLDRIAGHRNVKSTECPGAKVYDWIVASGGLRDEVEDYVGGYSSPVKTKVKQLGSSVVGDPYVGEYATRGGRKIKMTKGDTYFHPDADAEAHYADGTIRNELNRLGAQTGEIGFPVDDRQFTDTVGIAYLRAQGGTIYRVKQSDGSNEAFGLTGSIDELYRDLDFTEGVLGAPTSAITTSGTTQKATFAKGSITHDSSTKDTQAFDRDGEPIDGSSGDATASKTDTPKNLASTGQTEGSVSLKWDEVAPAPRYRIQYSTSSSMSGALYLRYYDPEATVTGLKPGTTYYFRVRTIEDDGTNLSPYSDPPVAVKTKAPAASKTDTPKNLASTGQTEGSVSLKWDEVAPAPRYRIQYSTSSSMSGALYLRYYDPEATVTGLKPGTTYYFRVRTIEDDGTNLSPYSDPPVAVKTSGTAPGTAEDIGRPASGYVTFDGHGYGHGIGMSQYGAEGGARAGKKYDEILRTYYPGTALSSKSGDIRVHITSDTSDSVMIEARSGLTFRNRANNSTISLPTTIDGKTVVRWSIDPDSDKTKSVLRYRTGSSYVVYKSTRWTGDGQFESSSPMSLVRPNGGANIEYRDTLRSALPKSGATNRDTVNVLSIEDYTRGVVAREMPSSWHAEALKSQSVAARTYGVRAIKSSGYFDICDTTSCQVYGGEDAETSTTDSAIKATAGKILTYNGTPAFAQFSSSSGGHTNTGSQPYLKAVNDPWDGWSGNKNHNWSIRVSASTIQGKYPTIGTVKSLEVTKRNGYGDMGGRVSSLKLVGSKGSKTITGVDARWAFGLRSDWFGF